MPTRRQLSRRKGWRLPPNTVNVARPSTWGNPFVVGRHGTRACCVASYRRLAHGYLDIGMDADTIRRQEATLAAMKDARTELRGKNLACWCPLDAPCHADVLLEIANDEVLC